jgi:hypothetical protein
MKLGIFIVLQIMVTTSIIAQKSLEVRINSGINLTGLNYQKDIGIDAKAKAWPFLGFGLQKKINTHYFITTDALFAPFAFEANYQLIDPQFNVIGTLNKQTLLYIKIPIVINYNFTSNIKQTNYFIGLGPSFNILTEEVKNASVLNGNLREAIVTNTSGERKFVPSLQLSFGITYKKLITQLQLEKTITSIYNIANNASFAKKTKGTLLGIQVSYLLKK